MQRINDSETYLNLVICGIFSVTACIQLIKIIRHKGAADKIHDLHPEDNPELVEEEEEVNG